ncbi:MAG: anthranilate synthase component I family protein [Nitrospirae bacterium]|nr:anthranilate synthase component I family protein [Nitrospirota bacterium]
MISRAEFVDSAVNGRLIPLVQEVPFPGDPLDALRALGPSSTFFLLEGQSARDNPRHSFLGAGPYARLSLDGRGTIRLRVPERTPIRVSEPFFDLLRSLLPRSAGPRDEISSFVGGMIGYFAYEFGNRIEPLRRILPPEEPDRPLAEFLIVDRFVAIDHETRRAWAVANPWVGPDGPARLADPDRAFDAAERMLLEDASLLSATSAASRRQGAQAVPSRPSLSSSREESPIEIVERPERRRYIEQVLAVKSYIAAGDVYQANISNRYVIAHGGFDPASLYASLRALNPSPFGALFATPERTIVSNSPERLFRVSGGEVEARPIAGTRPRGVTEEADRSLALELFLSEKERAEHVMLVDLTRNDLGRVCRTGSVHVNEFMARESYSHVHHIVSNVRGRLRPGLDALDALGALFPGGTITGVPKIRCREIIAEVEGRPRGIYTGSLGYISASGDADFNILIRSAEVASDRVVFCVGAGIVADSDPDKEFQEIQHKAGAFLAAVDALIREDTRPKGLESNPAGEPNGERRPTPA